ncbi:MAG: response regulator [Lactobacillus sp.]|jgi:two-component system CitB family response regulator|nr:response regulator [Lactobacillus sp.]
MNVLIVEDDPMVEFIHRNYLEKLGYFTNIYSANDTQSALQLMATKSIQLLLLDIHLKTSNGLEFLRTLRTQQYRVDVIVITAANESLNVQTGFHLGALDYLIKPFTFERFAKSIQLFIDKCQSLKNETIDQQAIDHLTATHPAAPIQNKDDAILEKGLSPETLALITTTIHQLDQPFSVQTLATKTQLSHVSVRKYLAYLETNHQLQAETIYTKVGRPYKVYHVIKA